MLFGVKANVGSNPTVTAKRKAPASLCYKESRGLCFAGATPLGTFCPHLPQNKAPLPYHLRSPGPRDGNQKLKGNSAGCRRRSPRQGKAGPDFRGPLTVRLAPAYCEALSTCAAQPTRTTPCMMTLRAK